MLRTEGTYEFREAGITNVSVGTLHGQLDGKDGYRNSYYHWTDNSGKARFAAVCLEYVGGNSNGISVLSLQPLGWYGEGNGFIKSITNIGGYVSSTATLVGGAAKITGVTAGVSNAIATIGTVSSVVGVTAIVTNTGVNYYRYRNGDITLYSMFARDVMALVETGLALLPYGIGIVPSIALTAYDLEGGFEHTFYNQDWTREFFSPNYDLQQSPIYYRHGK